MTLIQPSVFSTITPPKSQLLKWVGNKQKVASEICKYFPKDYNTFYEPFLGSGAITATIEPKIGVASDNFKPLIDIWKKLKENPAELIEWYSSRRNRLINEDKIKVYEDIKASFNQNHNGADFLYLTRSCYGGIIRFRKTDGYMSTPCGAHTPIPVESFQHHVKEWALRMKNVNFFHMDYKSAFEMAKAGDLIYCDPPYSYSQNILYGSQLFKLKDLFEQIELAKSKGIKVALSIDGHKKSGNYICDIPIPKGLFKEEIYITIGRSMLRRFQMEGQTLETELVKDRLLLTY